MCSMTPWSNFAGNRRSLDRVWKRRTQVFQVPSRHCLAMWISEDEFKQQLLKSGLMASLPVPADPASRPAFEPITIDAEPLSETIIRERR